MPLIASNPVGDKSRTALCRICSAFENTNPAWCDTPLIQTDNFVVVPSIGALVPGWLMVIPRHHVLSISAVPTSLRVELGELVEETKSLVARLFGSPVVFEHGSITENSLTACGVSHAHIHVVPLQFSLVSLAIEDKSTRWTRISHAPHMVTRQCHDYLLVGEHQASCFIGFRDEPVSQYFRKLIASALGMADKYDYRTHSFSTNVYRTIELVQGDDTFYSGRRLSRPDISQVA